MIGEKYSSMTILSLLPMDGKYRKVLCRCDCGNEKIVRSDHLKSGRTKSCGCLVGESKSNKLFGNKFGLLTPVNRVGRNYRLEVLWECMCDCGNTTIVKTSALTTGNTKSCGCFYEDTRKKSELTNKRFGLLVVISEHGSSSNGGILWKCQCDCGNECFRESSSLNGGGAVSCGCAISSIRKREPYSTEEFRSRSRIYCSKRRSLKRNAGGSYSKEQLSELLIKQKFRCANCGVNIKSSYHADHIYPLSRGGSNDIMNIQVLCPSCNARKQAIDPIVFAQKEGRLL